jgi:uncharacterized protein (TIGR02145 family)
MRNSIYIPVLFLTVFFFSICKTPVEIELYGDLSGIITDAVTKAPIAGAIVTLSPSSASTSTGSDGKYSFTKLDPLEYKIQVTIEGYETNTKNLMVKAGETTTGDLSLTTVQPVLDVSEMNLDFGEDQLSLPLVISNIGKSDLNWNIIESIPWLSVNPTSGKTTLQKSSAIFTIDRTNLSAGSYSQLISVVSNGGTKMINISMIVANQLTPRLTTGSAINVYQTTADVTGIVTSIGNGSIFKYGHCYSKLPNPTYLDTKTDLGTISAPGTFTSSLSGLEKNTTYYVRAYATNANGPGYSTQVTFTTSETPTLPNVTIVDASNVTQNSATLGGGIATIGSSTITQYGHCWSVITNPTITDSKTTLGSKSTIGTYSSNLTPLLPGTTYFVKAYASNNAGTSYSPEISFTTLQTPTSPTVTTSTVSNITLNGAQVAGSITNMGTSNITQHGHCWSTTTSPTVSNFKTQLGTRTITGVFSSALAGLDAGKIYYVRAYAVNSDGTSYGTQVEFKTVTATSPTVTTGSVSKITLTSVEALGNLTDIGTSPISQHGHCWSATTNPTISNFKTQLGTNLLIGAFTSTLTGLEAGKTYYLRAYATNADGTSYGTQVEFITLTPSAPSVATDAVSNIALTGAQVTGNITDLGTSNVTQYGHCWSYTPNPTTSNFKTLLGAKSLVGLFTSTLSGLEKGTLYYVRAYATNSYGTNYSSQVQFSTLAPNLATITTSAPSDLKYNSATFNANITDIGGIGETISEYGFCYSTSQNPTVSNLKLVSGNNKTSTGTYSGNATNLSQNTTYYLRAYAVNSSGTAYGNERSFSTPSNSFTITDVDGNVYHTVTIGTQTWLIENLRTTRYRNGESIINIADKSAWEAMTSSAWCDYENLSSNGTKYGHLYNWYAVNDTRNIAPVGWHVATEVELNTLMSYLGGSSLAGGKMKETGTLNWINTNAGANNLSGFTALPGGVRFNNGYFGQIGASGYFWSSTYEQSVTWGAWAYGLSTNNSNLTRGLTNKSYGYSVRCVLD